MIQSRLSAVQVLQINTHISNASEDPNRETTAILYYNNNLIYKAPLAYGRNIEVLGHVCLLSLRLFTFNRPNLRM